MAIAVTRSTGPIVLLTRPDHQAPAMIESVRALGLAAHNEPILDMVPLAAPEGWASKIAAIAVTSPNGARRLEDVADLPRTLPAFAVGPATAEELRALGFANIATSDGTAQSLIGMLERRFPPEAGEIVHVSGAHIACDVATELVARGYRSWRVVLYRADLRPSLTEDTRVLCRTGRIGAVTCMSQRIAGHLTALLHKHDLAEITRSTPAIAMSQPIADRLRREGWRHVRVAPEPSTAAVLEILAREARPLGLLS